MTSPYDGLEVADWNAVTNRLVAAHPLSLETIHYVALKAWSQVWDSAIGTPPDAIAFADIDPPAQIVGHFFEKLIGRVLANRFPGKWRGTSDKSEKDLVYLPDKSLSVEVKSSGQLGLRIYGNRSYGQEIANLGSASKVERSGYFITANFHGPDLMLLRFGWIDHSDWIPQKSPTGQMAGLKPEVYQHKLIVVPGDYQLGAPVGLLNGVGAKKVAKLSAAGISNIGQLLGYSGSDIDIRKLREVALGQYPEAAKQPSV